MSGVSVAIGMIIVGLAMIVGALVLRARRSSPPAQIDPAVIDALNRPPSEATPVQPVLPLTASASDNDPRRAE